MTKRFLHLIETPDGAETCVWQELRPGETMFDMTRTDIHCLYVLPVGGSFEPDHCASGSLVSA